MRLKHEVNDKCSYPILLYFQLAIRFLRGIHNTRIIKESLERGIKHSYTNSYTKNQLAKVDRKEFQKWIRSTQKAYFVIAGSIKFENLIAGRIKTVIHIVIQN